MKSIIATSALAIAVALGGGAASAAPPKPAPATHTAAPVKAAKEHTVIGFVRSYTPANRSLLLKSGKSYRLDASVTENNFKQGDKVQIRWKQMGMIRDADQVTLKN